MSGYDSPWKAILERYFEPFMDFFFPGIHADIDWTRGYEFLHKELEAGVKGLYQRQLDREDILEQFRFIDWLLELPQELESLRTVRQAEELRRLYQSH